jgi:hypothetical protein
LLFQVAPASSSAIFRFNSPLNGGTPSRCIPRSKRLSGNTPIWRRLQRFLIRAHPRQSAVKFLAVAFRSRRCRAMSSISAILGGYPSSRVSPNSTQGQPMSPNNCVMNERTWVPPDTSTQHLLEALRGDGRTNGDGLIRIFEIFNHVSQKVRQSVPGKQHPIFKASDLEDNFPVVLDRGGRKSFPASVFTPSSHDSDQWQRLGGVLTDLYPTGPTDQEIWSRAGGDLSRIRLGSTGRADWFAALRTLRQGGGGVSITRHSLIRAALSDFPHHSELTPLL